MLNPNEIDARHIAPLQNALLSRRSIVDEHRVGKLYRDARAAYGDGKKVGDTKTLVSRIEWKPGMVLVTCTDVDTGLYVQLAGEVNNPQQSMLTFGQKFCQEYQDKMRGNVATKIW